MIPIETPKGEFHVWTKRVGNNPDIKVLILHGGPGGTHEYLEVVDSYFPAAAVEYYHYDQLGSRFSDVPTDTSLWTIDRFVEEVEQVRQALNLDSTNFFILGHSWGGILGLEYALKYQQHLKGLIISNMMSSIPDYNTYTHNVLGSQLPPEVLAELERLEAAEDYSNPRYLELLEEHYYPKHVLRMPPEEWPEPVVRSFANFNAQIYVGMQGPSEFGIVGDAVLQGWDRSGDLSRVEVPVLTVGGRYDTMDPQHMEWMAGEFPRGRHLHCPKGSHLALYDDADTYFPGVIRFLRDVDTGVFFK